MTILSPEENNAGGTNVAPGGLPAALAAGATQTKYDQSSKPVFNPSAGPAADLFKSKYSRSSAYSLVYPKDLESSKRGHAVYFDIYEVSPLSFKDALATVGIKLPSSDSSTSVNDESGGHSVNQPNETTSENINNASKGTLGSAFKSIISPNQKNVNPRTKEKSVATIALYMPETLNFNYESNYNDSQSLASAGTALPLGLSSLGPTAIQSFMENTAAKLAMSAAGYVFNPQQQVLFEGISFRPFEMNFTFTPSSLEETNNINAIIKSFRYHAAPEIGGIGGFFYTPPSVFQVSFRYNGKVNPNINLLKRSVLKSVNVNYAPNGWAAFEGNGAPVQTTMSLQFQEIVLVDKKEIEKGF